LGGTRLLTLTGVGGCGKTRLALDVPRAAIDDYADGVWLVELGPLADPVLVGPHVATVLRVRETAEQTLEVALLNGLRQRTTLLVLDNCEHVLDACAQLIDVLLKACQSGGADDESRTAGDRRRASLSGAKVGEPPT
jgi:non-specific serine/threonine protein kinase